MDKRGAEIVIPTPRIIIVIVNVIVYTIPCAIIALATFMKPATLAPFT